MAAIPQVQFELPVDDRSSKCTEFKPFHLAWGVVPVPRCGRRLRTNPQMRGFWAATLAFFLAFLGWFAMPPLMPVIRADIGLCDNVLQDTADFEQCECRGPCRQAIADANIASVSLDVLSRFMLSGVLDKKGPQMTDVMLLVWGALLIGVSVSITNGFGLVVIRAFLSTVGSTFVVNQFWNSLLFHRSVVGLANATSGGWGNLGGGVAQILMPLCYRLFNDAGLELAWAWRAAMVVPFALYLLLAAWIYFFTQSTVSGKFEISTLGKTTSAGPVTYINCFRDYRIVLMFFQYGACLGCELVMNNVLAMHFFDYFGVGLVQAGALAASFGLMSVFARSLGMIVSNMASKKWAMRGRLWVHFLALLGEAVFLFLFGCVSKDMGWGLALAMLVIFSVFLNMAEGTCYSIVPYMLPEHNSVVSGAVGAGGVLGAVVCSFLYKLEDELLPFRLHGIYVLIWALSVMTMGWPHLGSMWRSPKAPPVKVQRSILWNRVQPELAAEPSSAIEPPSQTKAAPADALPATDAPAAQPIGAGQSQL